MSLKRKTVWKRRIPCGLELTECGGRPILFQAGNEDEYKRKEKALNDRLVREEHTKLRVVQLA